MKCSICLITNGLSLQLFVNWLDRSWAIHTIQILDICYIMSMFNLWYIGLDLCWVKFNYKWIQNVLFVWRRLPWFVQRCSGWILPVILRVCQPILPMPPPPPPLPLLPPPQPLLDQRSLPWVSHVDWCH